MDEQVVDPGKKKARRALRGCAISLVVLLVLAAVILVPAFSRANIDALILGAATRERDRVTAIAQSIQAFHAEFGQYPTSDEEWLSHDPNAAALLDAGEASVESRYRIRWDALGDPDRVVTMSPDRDFSDVMILILPWDRRSAQDYADRRGACRFTLLGDGTVTPVYGQNIEFEWKRNFAEWAGWSFKEEPPKE